MATIRNNREIQTRKTDHVRVIENLKCVQYVVFALRF